MTTPSLTIFANFRIDNEERYKRMKDSFMSFKDINAKKWVINVRGSYKLKTILFLREQLGENLYPHLLESGKGWFFDTRQMLDQIDTEFVFFWIEDHVNLVDVDKYDELLVEMNKHSVDHLMYTWHHKRIEKYLNILEYVDSRNLKIYNFDKYSVKAVQDNVPVKFYIISAASILNNKFFKNIINSNHPRLKRWPKETPFDFEKIASDVEYLPFNYGYSKEELFASIDDDHGEEGYSLISRGLYKSAVSRDEIKSLEYAKSNKYLNILDKLLPICLLNKIKNIYYIIKRFSYTL